MDELYVNSRKRGMDIEKMNYKQDIWKGFELHNQVRSGDSETPKKEQFQKKTKICLLCLQMKCIQTFMEFSKLQISLLSI